MLFIIIHQVQELWIKLILHELKAATKAILDGDMQPGIQNACTCHTYPAPIDSVLGSTIHP